MKNQSLTILFVIKPSKTNKKRICPLNVRITYLKKRKEASSCLMVNLLHWNIQLQKVTSKSTSGQQTNRQLEIIVAAMRKAYLQLLLNSTNFSDDEIWDRFKGKPLMENKRVSVPLRSVDVSIISQILIDGLKGLTLVLPS